jgi:hypothetical protein
VTFFLSRVVDCSLNRNLISDSNPEILPIAGKYLYLDIRGISVYCDLN